ncbi:MAG: hypothetical protein QOE33_3278 [Acidobacteriota bacterium]|nr:hypothetical protein [Acidobacteriota bacterium]
MTICRHCGAQVRDGKAFCFNCGALIDAPAVETTVESPPEFADTLSTFDPAQDSAQFATTSVAEQPRTVAGSETSQVKLASDATTSASARRGLMSGRVWIVIVLLLLLAVLGVVALIIFAD